MIGDICRSAVNGGIIGNAAGQGKIINSAIRTPGNALVIPCLLARPTMKITAKIDALTYISQFPSRGAMESLKNDEIYLFLTRPLLIKTAIGRIIPASAV